MDYEFIELEQIVSGLLNPAHFRNEKLTEAHFRQYATACFTEVERIIKKIKIAVLQAQDENWIKVYVHQHQAGLIGFADDIYVYLKSSKIQSPEHGAYAQYEITCCEEMYQCINKLLLFLERQYRQYFDLDANLTLLCHEEFARAIKGNLYQIKKELKRSAISEDLINITTDPLEDLQKSSGTISYRKRNYLQVLISEILAQINEKETALTNDGLCDLLLSLNHNCTRLLNFIIGYYETITKDFGNNNELMVFYFLKKKLLKQLVIKPKLAYNVELPNIREEIGNWFTAEIQFLERKQQLTESNGHAHSEYPVENQKIHTTLSVGELALILKLLVDTGIIVNCNNKEITKMVAKNFKTDRMENISAGSLRNKYYNVEKVTADKMKDLVFNLLNAVRNY